MRNVPKAGSVVIEFSSAEPCRTIAPAPLPPPALDHCANKDMEMRTTWKRGLHTYRATLARHLAHE